MSSNSKFWSKFYAAARWTGGDFLVGDFIPGGLWYPRVVQAIAFSYVAKNALLSKIFGEKRLELTTIRNTHEFDELPRLQCYLGSMTEDSLPTSVTRNEVSIYFGLRVNAEEAFSRMTFGEPTFDNAIGTLITELRLRDVLDARVGSPAQSCPIATQGHQEGSVSMLLDPDATRKRFAVTLEVQWTYSVRVDRATGKLQQIVDAGG